MRTLLIIVLGFVLLGVFVLIGRASSLGFTRLLSWFGALWFICAGVNMWIGVARAGYSFAEELPIFLLIFGIPVAAAILLVRFGRV
jgi:hypothetical protein